jgi:hypothetical protein
MIKINKQVAKSKISCFLERNQVVLFFHCNNSVSLNKNAKLLDLNKNQVAYQTRQKRVTKLNGPFINDTLNKKAKDNCETSKNLVFTNQYTFKSMMVKNRLAKKIFLELTRDKSLYSQNEDLIFKKRTSYIASLFQGPTLLLGCSDIKKLEKGIDLCDKYKELILLGAFYEKSIINHSQVKRVIACGNNKQGYVNLLSSIRKNFLRPFSLMRNLLSMQCLFAQQARLLCLLKTRKQQILVARL